MFLMDLDWQKLREIASMEVESVLKELPEGIR
jgi:hypothetical protein